MTIPSLVHGGVYKIINIAAGTVMALATAQNNQSTPNEHDRNERTQMWRAEHIGGQTWKLKNEERSGLYLDYVEDAIKPGTPLVGTRRGYEFHITQWNTRGGSEYRIWFPHAPAPGFVVEVDRGLDREGSTINVWNTNDTAAQFWLFQRIIA